MYHLAPITLDKVPKWLQSGARNREKEGAGGICGENGDVWRILGNFGK